MIILSFLLSSSLFSQTVILTNQMKITGAPQWVKRAKVEKVTDKIQNQLEWQTRRFSVIWHQQASTFEKAHGLGPGAAAVTIKKGKVAMVYMGPAVTEKNYEKIMGHELVHVIFFQKYRNSIPKWLEEGFANFLSRDKRVDKAWLREQGVPGDVTEMQHPFKQQKIPIDLHYKISQALVEMLDEKCSLQSLLSLSVERKLQTFIRRTCGIQDLNKDFRAWLQQGV